MRGAAGFTVLEVVVAAGLLTVGALAVGSFQVQALKVQRSLQVTRQLVQVVEAELDLQLALAAPVAGKCSIDSGEYPLISDCTVEAQPCSVGCGYAVSRGQRVRVRAESRNGKGFELEAVTAGFLR